MTGADMVAALLRDDPDVTAFVAPERIKLGQLPDGVILPAFLVRLISSVDWQPLVRVGFTRATDRIAVTVRAASYRDQVAGILLARRCCAGVTGTIAGAPRVSILTAGKGPDLAGPANSFEQTIDFRVSFDDPL